MSVASVEKRLGKTVTIKLFRALIISTSIKPICIVYVWKIKALFCILIFVLFIEYIKEYFKR